MNFPKRALISVSDKAGLQAFASALVDLGFEIVSTGGTRRYLEENHIPVVDVSAYTGFPEILEGRVKTLHPKVHGAILGRPDRPEDAIAISEHGIIPFQIVVCNLYPFEKTVARPDVNWDTAVEQIDVGGPSMVRAAAKNHAYVAVVTDPQQYTAVVEKLRAGQLSMEFRRELAGAAFERTANYDRAIATYFRSHQGTDHEGENASADPQFPSHIVVEGVKVAQLRYGENPHQQAALYIHPEAHQSTLAKAEVLHGKELSYNNLLDLDSALSIAREFDDPAAVVIKHNNPCGCGAAATLAEAFTKAYEGDPVSAFGSILGFNRAVDPATAELLCRPDHFIEAIIAPDYVKEAFEILSTRPKWAKSVRVLKSAGMRDPRPASMDYRSISGGLLVQDRDESSDELAHDWRVVTDHKPTVAQMADLQFAWRVARHVKSNAIVFARNKAVVGVGAGQMSRLDSVRLAEIKANDRSRGAVMASDAFFPFRDNIDAAAQAGISAIVEPGGSRRDDEVIAACNEHGIAMVFTGRRHFRH